MNTTDNSPMHTVLSVVVVGLITLGAFAMLEVVKNNRNKPKWLENEKQR